MNTRATKRSVRLTRDDVAFVARAVRDGADPDVLVDCFEAAYEEARAMHKSIFDVRCWAFSSLRLTKLHRAFRDGDHDSIKGIDTLATEIAGCYPELFANCDDPAARLFELLKLREGEYGPDRGRVWRQAAEYATRAGMVPAGFENVEF